MAPNDALPRSEKDGAPRLGGGMVRRGDDATAVSGGVEIHLISTERRWRGEPSRKAIVGCSQGAFGARSIPARQ